MTTKNRVWIELEAPDRKKDEGVATGRQRAKLASNLMRRLCPTMTYDPFEWSDRKQKYIYIMDSGGSYLELDDNGHWLNLDFLGRELEA